MKTLEQCKNCMVYVPKKTTIPREIDAYKVKFLIKQNPAKVKAYNTGCSQAVTHPSTDPARRCLTSVIGREPVHSAWYGRSQHSYPGQVFYIM